MSIPRLDLPSIALELQKAALAAVEPRAAVRRHAQCLGSDLIVADQQYDLAKYERVFLIGGGKAAVPMANGIADILGDRLTAGTIVTKYGHTEGFGLPDSRIRILEAGHPVPDENSVRGAQAIVDLARRAGENDLIVCLLSGGGSALLTLPVPGLTLADLQSLTDGLLRSGATINEMNTVRKNCSLIKGGNLARLVFPAILITLALSDVIGDPLDVIASGPTVPDPTTVADAQAVLKRHDTSLRVTELQRIRFSETPKSDDPAFERVQHVVVGSNRLAAMAAVSRARKLGLNGMLLSTYVEGEAREAARVAAALAKGMRADGDPVSPPACLVWGGETTVTVRGDGKGGRNQELALAAALALDGWPDVMVVALATDGTDGPTDAAGAIATGETVARAQAQGLDPQMALMANDSYSIFDRLGDLIHTGPTGTNVNDLLFILAGLG